ncbi:MAG TPA: hypothetical protein VH186_01360 [Chloroflexia bacterium]|nr:hypothetical protein [Chloroflexia bacterium]
MSAASQSESLTSAQSTANTGDRRWVLGWSLVVLLLAFVPFMVAYYVQPADGRFMGFLWNATDGNSYISRMEAGRRGEWLLHLTFTSEDHPGVLLHTGYYLLGKLAGLFNLPNILVFHLARVAAGAFLLYASWRFICRYFDRKVTRRTAFLLVCFGAGLGWLAAPLNLTDSTDLWVAESLSFFSILAHPHFPLATALLILSLMWLQDGWEAPDEKTAWRAYLKASLGGFFLGWVHPFLVVTLGVVAGVTLIRRNLAERRLDRRAWGGMVTLAVFALPMPIYVYFALNGNAVLAAYMKQNDALSPLPFYYLLGYGLLTLLALVGGWWVEASGRNSLTAPMRLRWQLVTTWTVITCLLLYIPFNFQRRFVEGLHLPVVLLATAGFFFLARKWKPGAQARRANMLVIVCSITTFLVLGTFVSNIFARGPNGDIHPLYLYNDEVAAMNWLRLNTQPSDTVIAGPVLGSYIPAFAGNRTFFGHQTETINRTEKLELLQQFFQFKMSREEMFAFIQKYGLKYVVIGPDEARMFAESLGENDSENPTVTSLQDLGWAPVYVTQKVQVYRLVV